MQLANDPRRNLVLVAWLTDTRQKFWETVNVGCPLSDLLGCAKFQAYRVGVITVRLRKARVVGFQSFSDTGEIEFSDGINLIVGQNNAGKSAFLKALLPSISDDRHRSDIVWQDYLLPSPYVFLSIEVSGAELNDAFLRWPPSQTHIPVPPTIVGDVSDYFSSFLEITSITFDLKHGTGNNFEAIDYPSHGLFSEQGVQRQAIICQANNGKLDIVSHEVGSGDTTPSTLYAKWQHDMFYFSAQRPAYGEAPLGYADRLDPAASNLPNVLNTLRGERDSLYQRLVRHIREVFPTIGNMSVRTTPQNMLEVLLWPTESMNELQLSFPLKNSGTGVAQVVAMFAAIMTVKNAVIIIDEINSFLHPAAVKTVLRILQTDYNHNQYIISTHAPEVIGFSNPRTIHLVKRHLYESTIESLDLRSVDKLREVAENLGVSMADVFAADKVIWVEGPTEELCFPYLYREFGQEVPRGTVFTSVTATGDFFSRGKRSKKIVYEVYERLSSAVATLPVSVAISFDTELLTLKDIDEMRNDSKGLIHFLPRRHLECYVVNPTAIAKFINAKDEGSQILVSAKTVEDAMRNLANERRFKISGWNGDLSSDTWLAKVDAANLIKATVETLTENRLTFSKKEDTLFLLQRVLEGERSTLDGLANYVRSLVEGVNPPQPR